MEKLKKKYEEVVMQYVNSFCKKHDLDFEGWVGDIVGEWCFLDGLNISFDQIKTDIDNDIESSVFWNYYHYDSIDMKTGLPNGLSYENYIKIKGLKK